MATAMLHATAVTQNCLIRNDWVCPLYIETRGDELLDATREHLFLTLVSVGLGVLVALPLGILAHRLRRARSLTIGVTTVLYTIPSIALFFLIVPMLGLSGATVVTGLTLYTLTVLVRNLLVGLDGVDPEVRDAAVGMGYARRGLLWRVELPLALPSAMAGLRVAVASTVALATIGTVVGNGGLGDIISRGLQANFRAEVLAASVLCVALAVVLDLLLLLAQRLLTPWQRTA